MRRPCPNRELSHAAIESGYADFSRCVAIQAQLNSCMKSTIENAGSLCVSAEQL